MVIFHGKVTSSFSSSIYPGSLVSHMLKIILSGVYTGDFNSAISGQQFQRSDFTVKVSTYLDLEIEIAQDRNFSILGDFSLEAKISKYPGLLKSPS